ncbi:MAG: succinylglutamate desuccinylase/aspartoacylase family protein [Gammaproteobacteria bacterium]
MARPPIIVGGRAVEAGTRATVELELARLHTHTPVGMPVQVVHGKRDGPTLCVSAAIHGDEINGIEIIRRLLSLPQLKRMRGTLLAVPIVNIFGVLHQTRYLPDRRDLNRSFPGSERGSLAARLAYVFTHAVLAHASHAIDLHTAAAHRTNLPQVRANLDDPEVLRLAQAFSAPVIVNSNLRDGSLRATAMERNIPVLLYEAGEALRFDEESIAIGVRGIVEVMRTLGMLQAPSRKRPPANPVVVEQSSWARAPASGILRAAVGVGERVANGQMLGLISDPFGESELSVAAPFGGIVIGRTLLPLVHEGDALFHVARVRRAGEAVARMEALASENDEEDLRQPDDLPIV